MKLKDTFITQTMGDEQIMVSSESDFVGMVRSNESAAFIVDCLKEDTTIDKITDALCQEYDAPHEVIKSDVETIIEKLCSIDALEE